MKRINLAVISVVVAAFVVSMYAFQPASSKATTHAEPFASATPRRTRTVPTSTREPIGKTSTNQPGFQEVSGIGMEKTRKGQAGKRQQASSNSETGKVIRRKQLLRKRSN